MGNPYFTSRSSSKQQRQAFIAGCATLERRSTQQYRTTQTEDMQHYPRRRITITAFVLLGLGFALLRLPLDQKSYASESANFLRGDKGDEKGGNAKVPPKGGMVRLSEVKAVPVNHDGSGATKQVMILDGQVPHLTGFTRSVFAPGDEVELHSHVSMDEVFYGSEGKGIIEVEGTVVQMLPGTCVHVAAGQKHLIKNTGDSDMVVFYFGIATEPIEGGGRGGGKGTGGGSALHEIGA